jgi:hypothetical protein
MARSTAVRLCEICKQPLSADRMEIPGTRLCTEHGEAIKKFGGEFVLTSQQERTSKEGSLKVNYGGIATEQIRNSDAIERLRDEFEQQRKQ